ncbi:MAG: hypothetical protein LBL92_07755 [Propionibacteriaceae bacterium]|jgi:hypothetical protein|nr:hypothetical protein [Propionibacteriaceae bacterium]
MTEPERPRLATLEGLPEIRDVSTEQLTKPVRASQQRPTPRWVGWVLLALPSLAVFGVWLGPNVSVLATVVIVLFAAAAWDWWRFQDRSRSLRVGYLGGIFVLTGLVLTLWHDLPWRPALAELGTIALTTGLALALVQLYRGAETVLTLARGWLYLSLGLTLVVGWQRWSSGPRDLTGPFADATYLAAAALTGLVMMTLGQTLEHDRRLRWLYPVAAGGSLMTLAWSHQTVMMLAGLGVVAVGLALTRWGRWVLAGAAVVGAVAAALSWSQWTLSWPDSTLAWSQRRELISQGLALARDTWFLGAGPGSYELAAASRADLPAEPYAPLIEVVSQYGLGPLVMLVLAGLGVLQWCLVRLLRTRGRSWAAPERVTALWCGLIVLVAPVLGAQQPGWLGAPLAGLLAATVVLLARHVENPAGRRVMTPLVDRRP